MDKKITLSAAILICLGITLGAVGAHIIKAKISPEYLDVFEKAVRYQFIGSLGMLIVGLNADKLRFKLNAFYWCLLFGILIFSGCLYLYSVHEIIPSLKFFARIVPIGGFAMIAAWIIFIITLIRKH